MKILVTGTDGYIGSVLAARLIRDGHDVVGYDTGLYRQGWLFTDPAISERLPMTLTADVRRAPKDAFAGIDAVVHLAELSNDPLGESNPEVTYDINHRGTLALVEAARAAGVERFVYASSCSVYGVADQDVVDETSPVNPQTAYAECKVMVERDLAAMADETFCPVFLRNATVYGASPRMRFDIVLNNLCGLAWTTGKIAMISDGTPWRPIVHVEDVCRAIAAALEAPADVVRGDVFNVGSNEQNYRIREIAEIVKRVFPDCELTFGDPAGDNRSYRVNFDKIHGALEGFRCAWDAEAGARQLRRVFERIGMSAADFESPYYTRLKCLQYLQRTGQIDADYYWTK